ncbi:pseudouridine synthase [Marinobacter sp. JSM 1782161]|uniref:pseudouridine synthase n=1 Tax=Marinobacter sp. JSM 1782161 TaxID=2685906 RepID=UPI00140413C7|nr:pseudouridine synthase [Marinobacter sp. JSM 1782161]
MRLDRFISKHTGLPFQTVRRHIAAGRVTLDHRPVRAPNRNVDRFSHVGLDGQVLQAQTAHYLMLHKPVGYLSATSDPALPTVIELMPAGVRDQLHIGGRLDRSTSGLLILTNDGRWSRQLTEPGLKLPKTYRVATRDPISPDTARRFAEGIYLAHEDLTTSPARLDPISCRETRLTIYEGRYHQVKRMFAAVGNRVSALHRESMGAIRLDPTLAPGESRPLTPAEIDSVRENANIR